MDLKSIKSIAGLKDLFTAAGWQKWLVVAIVVLVVILVGAVLTKAHATGVDAVVVVTIPPAVVVTPVVAPSVVAPSTATALPAAPATQPGPATGSSAGLAGTIAFSFVAVFFYAVICTSERHRNAEGFFAQHCKPKWME
jgi:hypothetical protein